jgi:MFS transporter, ACS family, hexuronate transporter
VAGMAGTFGNGGILVFNLVMGPLLAVIGYTPFFVCLGVLDLVGAVVLWSVVRDPVTADSNA